MKNLSELERLTDLRERIAEKQREQLKLIDDLRKQAWFKDHGIEPSEIEKVKPLLKVNWKQRRMLKGLVVYLDSGEEVKLPCPPDDMHASFMRVKDRSLA
jgi:hypothetical protein